jgi:hypothetical protein
VTRAGFEHRAGVATGSGPTTTLEDYRVMVSGGRLRLAAAAMSGTVLDVPLDRVRVRPLGRAGATVVEVDVSPILVDFTRRDGPTRPRAVQEASRVVRGLSGRWTRRRFTRATLDAQR